MIGRGHIFATERWRRGDVAYFDILLGLHPVVPHLLGDIMCFDDGKGGNDATPRLIIGCIDCIGGAHGI